MTVESSLETLPGDSLLPRLREARERMQIQISRLMTEKHVVHLPRHWRRGALCLVSGFSLAGIAFGLVFLQSPAVAQAPSLPPESEPPPSGLISEDLSSFLMPVPDNGPLLEQKNPLPLEEITSGPVTVYASSDLWKEVIGTRIKGREGKPPLNPGIMESPARELIGAGFYIAVNPEHFSKEYRRKFIALVSRPDFKEKSDEAKIEALSNGREAQELSRIANEEIIGRVVYLRRGDGVVIPVVIMDVLSAPDLAALRGIIRIPGRQTPPYFTVDVSPEVLEWLGVDFKPGTGFVDRKTGKPVPSPVVGILVYGD